MSEQANREMARLGIEPRTPRFSVVAPSSRPAVRIVAKRPAFAGISHGLRRPPKQSSSVPKYPRIPTDSGGFVPTGGVRRHKPLDAGLAGWRDSESNRGHYDFAFVPEIPVGAAAQSRKRSSISLRSAEGGASSHLLSARRSVCSHSETASSSSPIRFSSLGVGSPPPCTTCERQSYALRSPPAIARRSSASDPRYCAMRSDARKRSSVLVSGANSASKAIHSRSGDPRARAAQRRSPTGEARAQRSRAPERSLAEHRCLGARQSARA
jgi:hypothetical protein